MTKKIVFGPDFHPFGPIRAAKFFQAPSVARYHDQLSSCTEKNMIQSSENLVTDGQANRRTRVIL